MRKYKKLATKTENFREQQTRLKAGSNTKLNVMSDTYFDG